MIRNFTIEAIEPFLKVAGYRAGLALKLFYSGYDASTSVDVGSIDDVDVDIVLVMLRLEELVPRLIADFLNLSSSAAAELAAEAVDRLLTLGKDAHQRHSAPILVHNFVTPLKPPGGLSDSQTAHGLLNSVRRMNVDLAAGAGSFKSIHMLDIDHLFAQVGLQECEDARGARVAGAPLSAAALRALAGAQVRHIRAVSGPAKKCLVVDCDNTLWGGVVGEDGIARLILGESGAGRKHRNLQQDLVNLRRRGTVLAICSKNEAADVLDVLRTHPDMLLREDDFAAMRINWRDKAENIVSIAEELNLGLEHVVLLDDNPAECEWVRTQLPEVQVIEWPRDLEGSLTLDDLGLFDTLGLTVEDRGRTEAYRAETARRVAKQRSGSLADYLKSLNMVATVGQARPEHLPRVAQLILRTNQFNLTTRRHDMTALESLMRAPHAAVVWLDLCDRFGASGIVGCGILRNQGDDALIDTLLLSCRVIGRGAEAVLVHVLAKLAHDRGAATLVGEYIPSKRNALVANFYRDQGFQGPEESDEGLLWRWTLSRGLPSFPESLEVIYQDAER